MAERKRVGIITDFDNTLVETHEFIKNHLKKTLTRLGMKASDEMVLETTLAENLPFGKIFDRLFGADAERILEAYRENARETFFTPVEGGPEFIKRAKEGDILVVIVSNRVMLLSERLSQASYEIGWFLAVLEAKVPKPSPEAYQEALSLLEKEGVPKENVYFLGDSPDDLLSCPPSLRHNFFAVTKSETQRKKFKDIGLDEKNMVECFRDLKDKLFNDGN